MWCMPLKHAPARYNMGFMKYNSNNRSNRNVLAADTHAPNPATSPAEIPPFPTHQQVGVHGAGEGW